MSIPHKVPESIVQDKMIEYVSYLIENSLIVHKAWVHARKVLYHNIGFHESVTEVTDSGKSMLMSSTLISVKHLMLHKRLLITRRAKGINKEMARLIEHA
jgi:hypothetical protein